MSTISKLRRVCLAVVITFSVCLSATSKEEHSVRPTAKELVNLYKKAVTCWDKTVAMRVETDHSMAKRGTDETDIRHWKYDITYRRDGDRCEWFGHCQFEGEHDGDEYSFNEQFTKMVGDDFFLYYIRRQLGDQPGVMTQALMGSDIRDVLFISQAQEPDGGFLQGRMGGIGIAPKMVDVMCDSDSLNLIGQEKLNGLSCYIVEAKTKYGTHTTWISPEKGYNALKYIVRKSGRDILRDDIHIEDQGITEWLEVVDSIDVRKIDGVFVPISGKLTGKAKAGDDWESTDNVEVKRSEIVLNPDFKALGAFKISFPEGTEVTHQDIPGLRFRWTNGKFVPDMNKYLFKKLTGKPLPSFERIITGFDPESTTGKMVLVCFFDMNQRPSRNCIMQLSKKTKELKEKGVVIITVQVSKIEQAKLDEWIKKNSIDFPVGIIEGDSEVIHFAWGVKSLPWLILTDRKHIVKAEGFALNELEVKIQQINGD
jgi:glutaredoxin